MMGCLTAPFKLLGCLGLLIALAAGWLYRDRIEAEVRRLLGRVVPGMEAAETTGRPGERALASARGKVDSLNGWRADSVVLSASELASLIGAGLQPEVRRRLDSLRVHLHEGELAVGASLATTDLPKEALGPFAAALRPREPVEAVGPVAVVGPGRAEWAVQRFRIRDFPVPGELVGRFLGADRRAVPVRIPRGVTGIRVRPTGATLYGAPPR